MKDRELAEAIAEYEEDRRIAEVRDVILRYKEDLASDHDPSCECRTWVRWELQQARAFYFNLTRHDRQAVLDMP